jgi:transposase
VAGERTAAEGDRIHQDLVRDYGFSGSYPTVQRYVDRARPKAPEPVSERFETAPGHQAQVDRSHRERLSHEVLYQLSYAGAALPS